MHRFTWKTVGLDELATVETYATLPAMLEDLKTLAWEDPSNRAAHVLFLDEIVIGFAALDAQGALRITMTNGAARCHPPAGDHAPCELAPSRREFEYECPTLDEYTASLQAALAAVGTAMALLDADPE